MVRRKQADANMGEYGMTKAQADEYIEEARKGRPVDLLTLQRATMVAYRGKEPRKLILPIMNRATRMEKNAILLHNIGNARYRQLKESQHAERTAITDKDEPDEVRQADSTAFGWRVQLS